MNSNRPAVLIAIIVLALTLAACGGSAASTNGGSGASSTNALVRTASMKVGDKTETVLKNPSGLTLYYFTPDSSTSIACTGGCATTWPPLLTTSEEPTSSPALPGTLSVLTGPNGNQVLYNGHPLYTYASDKDAGDAYGEGIGGKWFVATPALSAATPSSSGGYSKGGY